MPRNPDLFLTGLLLIGTALALAWFTAPTPMVRVDEPRRPRLSDEELRRRFPVTAERMGRGARW